MNPTAIYSKSGKGVQEASGKTNLLARTDRAVLSAIDGRATLADVAQKVGKTFDSAFQDLVAKLDKDGFVREVSPGAAAPSAAKPGAKPAAKPGAKPAAPEPSGGDLDFSSLGTPSTSRPAPPPPRPAAPPPKPAAPPRPDPAADAAAKAQQSALQKAREEAEAKAAAERDRVKAEAEAKMRSEMESKARADAEKKMKEEAERRAKDEAEAKVKAAREAAARAAAEAKAKADAEAKAKIEAERKAREETERRLEQERRAREEAERKAREEAERARKQLEEERKAREAAERKAREEAERARKELEEERRKLEEERKREEAERAARRKREEEEEAERRRRRDEEEESERSAKAKARKKQEEPEAEAAAAPKSQAAGSLDSLMADLDSFTTREEEDRKEKEEAERKAQEAAARRAREDAERREKEEAERREKEEARARKDEEKRRKKEEEEELGRKREKEEQRLKEEEEKRKREADERERKAKQEEVLEAKATRGPAVAVGEDTDKVRQRMMGKRGAAAAPAAQFEAPSARARKKGWGKPVAGIVVLLLVAAVGGVQFMPVPTADYERAVSEAVGRPVKIGEMSLSLFTGLQLKAKNVQIGDDVRIASLTAVPEFETLRGERKVFSRIDFDSVSLPQDRIGEALFARVKADNFAVARVVVHKLELSGPVPLPQPLEADLSYGGDGALTSATLRGPDTLVAKMTPGSGGAVEFAVTASGFPLPMVSETTLSDFAMKGSANRRGLSIAEWGGKIYGGGVSGTANLRWGGSWSLEGVVTARNVNAAVFAPALLSEGKGEGTGRFTMAGSDPAKLGAAGRLEGNFTISGGVLGSFDLTRAIKSSGKEFVGRTQFTELTGQAVYDRGSVALRNVSLSAGALNAGASVDIAQNGALSGRIVADVKSSGRAASATLNLGGTVKEPQVRN
jgi:hypothetical protein